MYVNLYMGNQYENLYMGNIYENLYENLYEFLSEYTISEIGEEMIKDPVWIFM